MVARCPCSPEQASPSRTSELVKGRLARGSPQQGVGDSVVRLGQPPFPHSTPWSRSVPDGSTPSKSTRLKKGVGPVSQLGYSVLKLGPWFQNPPSWGLWARERFPKASWSIGHYHQRALSSVINCTDKTDRNARAHAWSLLESLAIGSTLGRQHRKSQPVPDILVIGTGKPFRGGWKALAIPAQCLSVRLAPPRMQPLASIRLWWAVGAGWGSPSSQTLNCYQDLERWQSYIFLRWQWP